MKFKFQKQKFQQDAVEAVCNVFKGESGGMFRYQSGLVKSEFAKYDKNYKQEYIYGNQNNPIKISETQLLENINEVQKKFTVNKGVSLTKSIVKNNINLTIEMETGTGKTYAYINTIYELHKRYGWKKYVIVVPNIAIRENTDDSFNEMKSHFKNDYGEDINHFVFNSQKKNEIDNFERDNGINVMIINAQAFNSKDRNTIHKADESGVAPIEKIQKTNPIIIIDEPQSVEGNSKNNKAREELNKFNALFKLRYSATHRDNNVHDLVYIFDSLDAIENKLVKKIEVMGIDVKGISSRIPYLNIKEILVSSTKPPRARIEYNILRKKKVDRTTKILDEGRSIFVESGEISAYKINGTELKIETIDAINKKVIFNNGLELKLYNKHGDEQLLTKRREQIKQTIKVHLEKELINFPKGIKTLSLFFIDDVERYRIYPEEGESLKGDYAKIFEEEYEKLTKDFVKKNPELKEYLFKWDVKDVHQGYFAKDKRSGKLLNPDEKGANNTSKDAAAFNEIVKNKKDLLSLSKPIRFIFSHSALREGWDNPNVFQICILRDHESGYIKKKQEVGRGLRLCVNNNLERIDRNYTDASSDKINVLTVIAHESFQEFAESLQNNYLEDLRDRPMKFDIEFLLKREINGEKISSTLANKIWGEFYKHDYVDDEGKLTDKFETDEKINKINLSDELRELIPEIIKLTKDIYKSPDIKEKKESEPIKAKLTGNYEQKHFQELLDLISKKSMYQVKFDSDILIENSIESINSELKIKSIKLTIGKTKQNEDMKDFKEMFSKEDSTSYDTNIDTTEELFLPSSIEKIMNKTLLKRSTILKILDKIKVFDEYKKNQEEFVLKTSEIINREKAKLISKNVEYYPTDIKNKIEFDKTINLIGDQIIKTDKKHIYDYLSYDSAKTELPFAEKLLEKDIVKVFARVPTNKIYFYTPVGKFSPDWLVILDDNKVKKFHFIVENKGTMDSLNHRPIEEIKIDCARKHFSVISDKKASFSLSSSFDDFEKDFEELLI